MKCAILLFLVGTFSAAPAATLTCSSAYTVLTVSVSSDGAYSNTKAINSGGDPADLLATNLVLKEKRQTVSTFSTNFKAFSNNCTIDLPNQVRASFDTRLLCRDPSGKVVNDEPAEGQLSPVRGEAMHCSLQE